MAVDRLKFLQVVRDALAAQGIPTRVVPPDTLIAEEGATTTLTVPWETYHAMYADGTSLDDVLTKCVRDVQATRPVRTRLAQSDPTLAESLRILVGWAGNPLNPPARPIGGGLVEYLVLDLPDHVLTLSADQLATALQLSAAALWPAAEARMATAAEPPDHVQAFTPHGHLQAWKGPMAVAQAWWAARPLPAAHMIAPTREFAMVGMDLPEILVARLALLAVLHEAKPTDHPLNTAVWHLNHGRITEMLQGVVVDAAALGHATPPALSEDAGLPPSAFRRRG